MVVGRVVRATEFEPSVQAFLCVCAPLEAYTRKMGLLLPILKGWGFEKEKIGSLEGCPYLP